MLRRMLSQERRGGEMKKDKPFANLEKVWKRVEQSRKGAQGSAALKPRLDPSRRTDRFAPRFR